MRAGIVSAVYCSDFITQAESENVSSFFCGNDRNDPLFFRV